jgi:hypothetical protein
MTRYNTLLLDRDKWDLVIDTAGNIAMASPPYSLTQDVASAIKLFLGELWYDNTKGIPYFQEILGKLPPVSILVAYLEKAALTVPGVSIARCSINSFQDGKVNGQVQFIDEVGVKNAINF